MRFQFRRDGRVHRVELSEAGGDGWRARWSVREADGADARVLKEGELELHVHEVAAGSYSVLAGDDVHEVLVDRQGASRTVSLPGGAVTLEHLDPYHGAGQDDAGAGDGPRSVASPMPGRVVKLAVAAGDEVAEGQTVIVVEAMKMANELRSPVSGRVTTVNAAEGEAVEAGKTLVVVEP